MLKFLSFLGRLQMDGLKSGEGATYVVYINSLDVDNAMRNPSGMCNYDQVVELALSSLSSASADTINKSWMK